jgi:DNA-binding SARP family transcriptional activator
MEPDGSGAIQPPHLGRLLRRLRSFEDPLIEVWGWPGSGRSALLAALLETEGERAAGLAIGDLAEDDELRRALARTRAGGARWLVASACAEERIPHVVRWLVPGERLVFATDRRIHAPAGLSLSVLCPQELLLDPQETATLWYLLTGTSPEPAASLRAATDGWYKPLRLALEATGGGGLAGAGPEALLEIPAVRSFLRHEVIEALAPGERETLLAAPPEPAAWSGAAAPLGELVDALGLWVDGAEGERPPRLLAAYLERAARRRSSLVPGRGVGAEAEERSNGVGGEPAPPRPGRRTGPRGGGSGTRPIYRLGLLGDPFVQQQAAGGARDLGWRLRRSFQVLAYLAASPGLQAGREDLIEAIWPREGERTIDRNFHPTLSHLRRALEGERRGDVPPPLLFRGGVYRLNPEIAWQVDLLEFRERLERGQADVEAQDLAAAAAAWEGAWKLYRGPFLQGYYDAWVNARRELYQRLYLELLRDLGDLYVRLGRAADAMDAYRAVLIEDPLQERIHVAVMRLYAGQGRRELVRRQYDRLCTLLAEELGVSPLTPTTDEYHRLMK